MRVQSRGKFRFLRIRPSGLQILEAVNYAGARLRISAKIEIIEGKGSFDLWANLDDFQNRPIDSQSARLSSSSDSEEFSVVVDVPKNASKLSFGVRSLGDAIATLEALKIEVIDDGRVE